MPNPRAIWNGRLAVHAELGPRAIATNMGGEKRYVTACAIEFKFAGMSPILVPADFEFDGPSIPRPFWIVAGLSPADIDTAPASCIHDYGCEHPELIPRDLADAMFRVALGPLTINDDVVLPGVQKWRQNVMYAGVRYWSHRSGALAA